MKSLQGRKGKNVQTVVGTNSLVLVCFRTQLKLRWLNKTAASFKFKIKRISSRKLIIKIRKYFVTRKLLLMFWQQVLAVIIPTTKPIEIVVGLKRLCRRHS